ncbi:MAG TPA: glycosyltransferase family 39 protein [Phycisphaerae bacterium]|nr:glycosyltransferase family 39 protein [Phycisphaerae bacterium]
MAEEPTELLADGPRVSARSWSMHVWAIALIGLAVCAIGARGITRGGVGWSDGANHLFDGVFVYEFVRAWPVDGARSWAEQFYLRFPSLGIVVYWPPGFAAIEAIVFAVTGVSLLAARCVVLAFAFAAAYTLFRLLRDVYDDGVALLAALLLATCPFGELWMTDIMLEWPATFWMLLAAWAHVRSLMSQRQRSGAIWSIVCGGAIAAAFLTKQTAGFIWPVILLHSMLSRGGRRWLLRRSTIGAFALAAMVIGLYERVSKPYAGLASRLLEVDVDPLWYARHGGEIFGWGILAAACIGIVVGVRGLATRGRDRGGSSGIDADPATLACSLAVAVRNDRESGGGRRGPLPDGCRSDGIDGGNLRPAWLLGIWFFGWCAFSSAIEAKEPRYLFYALPPVVTLAAFGIRAAGRWFGRGRREPLAMGLLAGLVIVGNTAWAIANSRGRLPTYAPAVETLVERGDADLVLVDAVRDGQFVFDVYDNPAARGRIIPLRASKLLYARAARMKYGGEIRVEREADIVDMLDALGIRYIVMESQAPRTNDVTIDPAPRKLLRSLVADSSRFVLRGEWSLACDDPDWADVTLRVYEYLTCPERTTNRITIPVPAMGRDVEIELP